MASINLSGVLRDPLGEVSYGNKVRFTHLTTTGETLKGFRSQKTIVVNGAYDIDLEYGNVVIETFDNLNRRWICYDPITINSDTPANSLPALLGITTPATDADLLVFQALAADAAQSASDSANSAIDASDSYNQSILAMQKLYDASGGTLINRLDSNGNYNVMVRINAFTLDAVNAKLGCDIGTGMHPAFIKPDGTFRTHFEYAMYQASNDGTGSPVSAPSSRPWTSINFDSSKAKCESMGEGWHLASNTEWAAVVFLCLMNEDADVHGNTNYGRYHGEVFETGIRQDGALAGELSGTALTLTGSGPLSWRHNKAISGIADMVGNCWEWQDGFKQVEGQITVAEYVGQDESEWVPQGVWYNGNSKLATTKTSDSTGISLTWGGQQRDTSYTGSKLLQALLIEPIAESAGALGRLYCSNTITGFPVRGGSWNNGSYAGLGALNLNSLRSKVVSSVGFRPAFFE